MEDLQRLKNEILNAIDVEYARTSELFEQKEKDYKYWMERKQAAIQEGDLSENFDYTNACDELEKLNVEMVRLDLRKTEIQESDLDVKYSGLISEGSMVTLKLIKEVLLGESNKDKALEEFTNSFMVVPSCLGDARKKRVSSDSPIGKQILGKKESDKILVKVPRGILEYEIVEVQ